MVQVANLIDGGSGFTVDYWPIFNADFYLSRN